MIDRITIYIDDVKFEDVEKRLGLTPSKVAEDESLIYSSLISNLRFTYKGNRLTITGCTNMRKETIILCLLMKKLKLYC